jgi:hypothetical protein
MVTAAPLAIKRRKVGTCSLWNVDC